MPIADIVRELDLEIARLQEVRKLLTSTKVASGSLATAASATKSAGRKRRRLSPEARKRIAEAQRRRWAAQKAKK